MQPPCPGVAKPRVSTGSCNSNGSTPREFAHRRSQRIRPANLRHYFIARPIDESRSRYPFVAQAWSLALSPLATSSTIAPVIFPRVQFSLESIHGFDGSLPPLDSAALCGLVLHAQAMETKSTSMQVKTTLRAGIAACLSRCELLIDLTLESAVQKSSFSLDASFSVRRRTAGPNANPGSSQKAADARSGRSGRSCRR